MFPERSEVEEPFANVQAPIDDNEVRRAIPCTIELEAVEVCCKWFWNDFYKD